MLSKTNCPRQTLFPKCWNLTEEPCSGTFVRNPILGAQGRVCRTTSNLSGIKAIFHKVMRWIWSWNEERVPGGQLTGAVPEHKQDVNDILINTEEHRKDKSSTSRRLFLHIFTHVRIQYFQNQSNSLNCFHFMLRINNSDEYELKKIYHYYDHSLTAVSCCLVPVPDPLFIMLYPASHQQRACFLDAHERWTDSKSEC